MREEVLLAHMRAQPFLLAPMAAITDRPFRTFMREMGCGIVTSELVSATGLKYSSEKTLKLMEFDECQHPVGIQIFGEELEHLSEAAKKVEQLGADFVDINFGCPVPKVVKRGAGSACLKDLLHLRDVLRAVKSGTSLPVTIKVRTGWDENSRNSPEVARIAYDEGITWMAIHGRTRSLQYNGFADWDYIQQVKETSPIPIIGNGDLISSDLAVHRLKNSGCDAVMIGRGCLKNPFIFLESYQKWKGENSNPSLSRNYYAVLERLRGHLETFYDEKRLMIQLKKFASWYSAGFPESASFRKSLFTSSGSKEDLLTAIHDYFQNISENSRKDTSGEAFLMGGHG